MTEELYRLAPEKCALLVIDIQENLMPVIHDKEGVARNAVLLVRAAKVLDVPIVATTQYAARIGEPVPEVKEELAGVAPLDKMEFDCFGNNTIAEAVKKLPRQVNTLVVCGVETHICIYQTVLGGLVKGYRMWVPADAVSSRRLVNYKTGLARMRDMGAVIANTEMIIYEWLGKAGTPQFKELLPVLK